MNTEFLEQESFSSAFALHKVFCGDYRSFPILTSDSSLFSIVVISGFSSVWRHQFSTCKLLECLQEMERSFGLNTPRKRNTTVPTFHLLKKCFLKNSWGPKTRKTEPKKLEKPLWSSTEENIITTYSFWKSFGFSGHYFGAWWLSGACQYQRRVCPSPRYSKKLLKRGFKTCGWLTKSSASDVKYCHLTAFWEILHKLNWQPGVQQAKYANGNWYSSQQLEAKGQGQSVLQDELSPQRWRWRCTDGKSARLFCLQRVPRMDKYTTRCSSLSGKLSLLTRATLIKTESKGWEAEPLESFGRGMERCVGVLWCNCCRSVKRNGCQNEGKSIWTQEKLISKPLVALTLYSRQGHVRSADGLVKLCSRIKIVFIDFNRVFYVCMNCRDRILGSKKAD